MSTTKIISLLTLGIFIISFTSIQNAEAALCTAPDVAGTVENPISACDYESNPEDPMLIINGLPGGDTIEFVVSLEGLPLENPPPFVSTTLIPGGNFGVDGEIEQDVGILLMDVQGTGSLGVFSRSLQVTVNVEGHTDERFPGNPVQSFPTEMVTLQGTLFGDPDFCTFNVLAGSSFPIPPSPGQTQLTDLGANFQVDSFFDITYEIDFVGCPGSLLEGFGGTTQGTIRLLTQDLDGDGLPDGLDPAPNNPCNPNPTSRACNPVGGTIIPIESTSLIVAGTQLTTAWLIPVLVSAVGIGLVLIKRKSKILNS